MEKANIHIPMAINMKDNLDKILNMELVVWFMQIKANIMGSGKKGKNKVKDFTFMQIK